MYKLLPAIYREADKSGNLREFLEIISEQASIIRQDINNLYNDFFIDTCSDWAVPYLGDLVGAGKFGNIVDNRLLVKNAIPWRKRKGTIPGLENVLSAGSGWNVRTREGHRHCASSLNLKYFGDIHLKSGTADIRSLGHLYGATLPTDALSHLIDFQRPTQFRGWHNPKNILLFLSRFKIRKIEDSEPYTLDKYAYYFGRFSNIADDSTRTSSAALRKDESRYFQLFTNDGFAIDHQMLSSNPANYFGESKAFDIKIRGILAAEAERTSSSSSKFQSSKEERSIVTISGDDADNPDFLLLDPQEGVRIVEPWKFQHLLRDFVIRAYSYSDKHELVEVGRFETADLRNKVYCSLKGSTEKRSVGVGKLIVSVEPKNNRLPSEFPQTIIALRDARKGSPLIKSNERKENTRWSKLRNALYVYLPRMVFGGPASKYYFFVDEEGTTLHADLATDNKLVEGKVASQSFGQVYPAKVLTYSLDPLKKYTELNRNEGIAPVHGLENIDGEYLIEAFALDPVISEVWKIGHLVVKPNEYKYINSQEIWLRWNITNNFGKKYQGTRINLLSFITHLKTDRSSWSSSSEKFDLEGLLSGDKTKAKNAIMRLITTVLRDSLTQKVVSKLNVEKILGDIEVFKITNSVEDQQSVQEYDINLNLDLDLDDSTPANLLQVLKVSIESYAAFANDGITVLKIRRASPQAKTLPSQFPLCEILLTNKSGKGLLVYLPQVEIESSGYLLGIGSDGSTFELRKEVDKILQAPNAQSQSKEHEIAERIFSSFTSTNLVRRSAGQVMPIEKRYPLQQRVVALYNIKDLDSAASDKIMPGELALDAVSGRAVFSRHDGPMNLVRMDYNLAISSDSGAETLGLEMNLPADLKRREPTIWVIKNGHSDDAKALPSRTFQSISEAISYATNVDPLTETVIQIEDSGIYEEEISAEMSKTVTIQAKASQMPIVRPSKNPSRRGEFRFRFTESGSLTLSGLGVTGSSIVFEGSFRRVQLICCTIDPVYSEILFIPSNNQSSLPSKAASTSNAAELEENIVLYRSISGPVRLLNKYPKLLTIDGSIVHNPAGPAISSSSDDEDSSQDTDREFQLSVVISNSTLVSQGRSTAVISAKAVKCVDSIIVGSKLHVRTNNADYSALEHCRYEPGSKFEFARVDGAGIDMTTTFTPFLKSNTDVPIFISITFTHPYYLQLHHNTKGSILEGGKNGQELGAGNSNSNQRRANILNMLLPKFLPFGIKGVFIDVQPTWYG